MSEKVSITKSKLDSLANAIASVGETSVPKTIAQMESAVLELTIPPNLQSKTITPLVTQQIVSPDSGYDAFSQVTVNAMPSGTAGTPTATKGTVSNHSISVTPSVTNTTGYITGNTINGTPVTVDVTELESGAKSITENGTGISVSGYSTVDVAVQAGTIIDDGDGNINLGPTGEVAVITPLAVNQNGTYTAPSNTGYSPVTVNVESSSVERKDVNFIDYDGTLLRSYTKTEFANLSGLPSNPTHTGLISQGWNRTLVDAKTQVAEIGKCDIGQMYVTESGNTELDIELYTPRLSPFLSLAINGTVEIDWGDGSQKSTATGSSLNTIVSTGHTYAREGEYTISVKAISGDYALLGEANVSILNDNSGSQTGKRAYANSLIAVRVGNGVTSIGSDTFRYCYSLVSITIPNSVTSIEGNAFYNCNSLVSVTIPDGVTSIALQTFYNCYSLVSITIPDSVMSIGNNAFDFCCSLTSITIPDGVTNIGNNAFGNCYSLVSVTIPDSVTNIGNSVFVSCYSLVSITIPDSVMSIGNGTFYACRNLVSVTIPDSVTSIGYNTFYECNSLISVTIPDTITSIGNNFFYNCYSLVSATIPDSITSIGNSAFRYCYSLGAIHFESETPPTVGGSTAFGNVPDDCIIYVPVGKLSDYTSATYYPSSSTYTYVEE